MRRIDVIAVGFAVFGAGGLLYVVLLAIGLDNATAGIWAEAGLVVGIVVWLLTYLLRVLTRNMTYNQQMQDYEDAVLQKRLDAMSPAELAKLQAEIEQERQQENEQKKEQKQKTDSGI